MRLRIVACEIFFRELCHLAARSPRKVDVEFLPKGLHDQGGGVMRERLQAAIDATDPGKHDAVALAYGLCNNGLVGLEARALPLVLLRAHDCITAFLGSRARYARYFDERPGTYFETTGWLERGVDGGPYGLPSQTGGLGFDLAALDGEVRRGQRALHPGDDDPPLPAAGLHPHGCRAGRRRSRSGRGSWPRSAAGSSRRSTGTSACCGGSWTGRGTRPTSWCCSRASAPRRRSGDEVIVAERISPASAGAGDRR